MLVNDVHQPANSPYKSSHAIFARKGAQQARLADTEVPKVLLSRLILLRLFYRGHMMVATDVVQGAELAQAILRAFADPAFSSLHLHCAKPGCFAATVHRT